MVIERGMKAAVSLVTFFGHIHWSHSENCIYCEQCACVLPEEMLSGLYTYNTCITSNIILLYFFLAKHDIINHYKW